MISTIKHQLKPLKLLLFIENQLHFTGISYLHASANALSVCVFICKGTFNSQEKKKGKKPQENEGKRNVLIKVIF